MKRGPLVNFVSSATSLHRTHDHVEKKTSFTRGWRLRFRPLPPRSCLNRRQFFKKNTHRKHQTDAPNSQ